MKSLKQFSLKINRGNKFHFTIFLYFIIIVFVVIVSTTWVFSSIYLNNIYNQLSIDLSNSLERLNGEFGYIFSGVKQMNTFLARSSETKNFLQAAEYDYPSINRANQLLTYIKNTSEYTHSIILYNKNLEFPITSGATNIDSKQFFKPGLKRPDTKNGLSMVISSTNPSYYDRKTSFKTLSIIFSDSYDNGSVLNNAIIFTLDRNFIEKHLLGRFDGITMITDNSGRVIFKSFDYPAEDTISNTAYFQHILASAFPKGSFNTKIDDEDKIVTYAKNMDSDFYIVNFRSVDAVTSSIKNKRNLIIAISMAFFLLFGFVSYIIAQRIYSPIKKVADLFSNSKFGTSSGKLSEIAMISSVYKDTLNYVNNLESKNESNKTLLKEEYLRNLLKAGSFQGNSLDKAKDYDFDIEFVNLFLAAVKIDNYGKIPRNEGLLLDSTICKIIPQVLGHEFRYETVNMYNGEAAIFLNFRNNSENNFQSILAAMDMLREKISNTLKITVSIGIEGIANSPAECFDTYKNALNALKHRFVLGTNGTYYKRYLEEQLHSNFIYPLEIEESLITSIRLNKREVFDANLQNFIELLRNYNYSEAFSAFIQMVAACIKTINQITSQFSSKFYLNFDEFDNTFSSLQTLEQAKDWLLRIFDEYQKILEDINLLKNNKHFKMVENTQEYINLHYQASSLSIEALAELAGYTPYYFSKIFKEITGLNPVDYIRHVRVSKAKELLGQADKKISEIAELAGFTNVNHFYAVFKKDVGLTPSAYRDHVIKGE